MLQLYSSSATIIKLSSAHNKIRIEARSSALYTQAYIIIPYHWCIAFYISHNLKARNLMTSFPSFNNTDREKYISWYLFR